MTRALLITALVIGLPLLGYTAGTLAAKADALALGVAETQDADSLERDYIPPADCCDDDQRGC